MDCRATGYRFMAGLLLAVAVSSIGGCQEAGQLLGNLSRPRVSLADVRVEGLTAKGANLVFDVDVSNPYPVPLPVADASYALATTGEPFLTGSAELAGTVPAGGSRTFTLPVDVSFQRLLSAATQLKPGQVANYVADLTFSVDAPQAGPIQLPLRKRGQLPIPAVPSVAVEDIRLDTISPRQVAGTLVLQVGNTNEFAVDLSSLRYALALAGRDVAQAAVDQSASFAPGQRRRLEIPLSLSPADLGLAGLSVFQGSEAAYQLGGTMNLATPYGPIRLPFNQAGQTPLSR